MKKEQILDILMLIVVGLAMIFYIMMINISIGAYIDHQCYQLEPNEQYVSTICERYWK